MKKINLPALAFCGLLNLGIFNCASAPEVKKETLEFKLDAERISQSYTLDIKKGNLSIGINPVRYEDGKAGYIIGIYDRKSENEYIDMIFEIYEDRFEIDDTITKKKRLAPTNCYAGEIKIKTPEFYMVINKKYETKGNEKVFSKWWHVYGNIYGKYTTIIDTDGDGNPERLFYKDNQIELYGNKNPKNVKFLGKNKDMIAGGIKLFEGAKKYFLDSVGDFEEIKF